MGILFMADRIHFCKPDSTRQKANSGAPPVLCAFGKANVQILRGSGVAGPLVSSQINRQLSGWNLPP
jgi:hypothetical protein